MHATHRPHALRACDRPTMAQIVAGMALAMAPIWPIIALACLPTSCAAAMVAHGPDPLDSQ